VEQTVAMKVGSMLEATIGELWAEDHPEAMVFRPGARLWRHPVHEWMVATPDYFVATPEYGRGTRGCPALAVHEAPEDAHAATVARHRADDTVEVKARRVVGVKAEPLECKSDEGGAWGKPGTDEVPVHHLVQCLQQMAVLGADRGHLMRLAGKRPTAYLVTWTPENLALFGRMVAEGQAFMATVEAGIAPDLDDHKATTDTLARINPAVDKDAEQVLPDALVAEWLDVTAALNEAKAARRRAENLIRHALGRAEYAVDAGGRRLVQRRHYKRRGYEVAPAIIDSINPVKSYERKDVAK
jgi:predicted phage-related endonuclease